MSKSVFVFDPTTSDTQSKVRGIGRYLQILKENFPEWIFTDSIKRIHTDSTLINPFFNLLQQPLIMRRVVHKQIAVIHDIIPLKYPDHFPIGIRGRLNVFLNKLSLKNYDRIITDSEASKKDIVEILKISENKVTVIYPCLPKIFTEESQKSKVTSSFPRRRESRLKLPYKDVIIDWIPSYEGMTSSNFCLYVGDATWNKNLVNLAKAIKIINVSCVFVGKVFEQFSEKTALSFLHPWQKELKEFLKEIQDDKRFILKGFVSDEELIQLYQQTRVNVLPSRDEGFGFSYLEAASQKCPSVLADIDVLHEISGNNAVFTDPNNPQAVANAIGALFFDDKKKQQIGESAYRRSLFFSSSNFKKSFLNVLK